MWVQLSKCMDIIMTQLSVVTLYNRACGLMGTLPHLWGNFTEFMITSWCGSVYLKYLFCLCLNVSRGVTVEDLEAQHPDIYREISQKLSCDFPASICTYVQLLLFIFMHVRSAGRQAVSTLRGIIYASVWIWNGYTTRCIQSLICTCEGQLFATHSHGRLVLSSRTKT